MKIGASVDGPRLRHVVAELRQHIAHVLEDDEILTAGQRVKTLRAARRSLRRFGVKVSLHERRRRLARAMGDGQ